MARIKELKKQFMRKRCNRISELYSTLSEIVKLRKITNKRYRARTLQWESDIKLKAWDIRYIFAYEFISKYTMDKIDTGLLEDATVYKDNLFNAIKNLNKFIKNK
jgi:hypothetical protein